MKAWQLHEVGKITFDEVEIPEINDNEVLVNVKAAGICGSDIPRIYQTGAYHHPLIPGHEFSGIVVKCGKNAPEFLGKRVGIFPLIPCIKCAPCLKKQFELCRNYNYLGSRKNGGFAEFVAVPAENLIELPENISFEQAAMLEPMAVAVHAIRRTNPQKNDKIIVNGLGAIGLFVVMFLKEMGIKNITAIGNKDYQRNLIEEMNLQYLNCNCENVFGDIVFECVGSMQSIDFAVNSALPNGKIITVGNPHSDIIFEKSVYWKILRNQLTVIGTWNSSFTHENSDDWHNVLQKLSENKINPEKFISHKFPLEQLEKGFLIMRDKSENYTKIIMSDL